MGDLNALGASRTMRVARIVAPRKLALEDAKIPDPKANEVRIKVRGCGVCASNLGPWLGLPWFRYPMAPGESGHEAWGEVDAVGAEVQGLERGDVVGAVSYNAYAEYDVAQANAVVKIPQELQHLPFPGEPLGCALNVFRRCQVEQGHTVAVVGVGFMGALLTRLATLAGARVIAISRREYALGVAAEMGADHIVAMRDHAEVLSQVRKITDGAWCDRVIEAVGQQWPLDLAAEITKTRGTLVIAGYHQDGPRQVNMQLWNWRGIDVINAHERPIERYVAGMRDALTEIATRRLDPSRLYTHTYPLEGLAEALDATFERPTGFMKALITP